MVLRLLLDRVEGGEKMNEGGGLAGVFSVGLSFCTFCDINGGGSLKGVAETLSSVFHVSSS